MATFVTHPLFGLVRPTPCRNRARETRKLILLSTTYGGLALVLTPVVLVGWSRLYLKRHTFPQVLAGSVPGAMIFLVLLSN